MIINTRTGRIAYHSILLQENGPAMFVQKGFDGKVLYEKRLSETNANDYRQYVDCGESL
jgi:hypothetical protein